MFKSIQSQSLAVILVATGLAGAAMPAIAKGDDGAPKARLTVEHKNGKTVYCLNQQPTTGSIAPVRTCRTRSEWADAGLVIPDQQRAETSKEHPEG